MNLPLIAATATAAAGDETLLRSFHAQPSFVVSTKEVEVAVTKLGGNMAPVTFFRDSAQPVRPYHVSPWQDEKPSKMPAPVLVTLRGDFFCLPFGGNGEEVAGEKHPPHGEIVGDAWHFVGTKKTGEVTTLTLGIETNVRKGRVTKELSLVDGQNVVYSRNTIEGFAGRVPLGHHATLAMPEKEGAVRIATSAFRFGMTAPSLFSDPKQREYQALLPGAKWKDLARVPAAWKDAPDADLTRLPGRYGYADLVQIANESWEKTNCPAWIAATYPDAGYVWFSMKDPAVLNSTVFWMEYHGRHGHPWNGRNNCLGLEDVTAFFADGLAASTKENSLTKEGVDTTVALSADKPTAVNYIQGVVKIPAGFENVKTLEFAPGQVTFISTTGNRVIAPVRHEFLKTGKL
ncbi:MAG: hypothetical protein ORN51_06605 [Akkermansiaceae bacterium]|nr:hypothetical protein [Akkermansiaceae bacterium]